MKIHNPRHLTEVRKFAMEISHFLFIALLMVGCGEEEEATARMEEDGQPPASQEVDLLGAPPAKESPS